MNYMKVRGVIIAGDGDDCWRSVSADTEWVVMMTPVGTMEGMETNGNL